MAPEYIVVRQRSTDDPDRSRQSSLSVSDPREYNGRSIHVKSHSDDIQSSLSSSLSPSFSTLAVVSSLSLYSVVSLSIVYFNWWLFTSAFQYPVFVSWIQQVFGLILFVLLAFVGQFVPVCRHFPYRKPEWEIGKRVFPLSLSFTVSVGLSNMCLKFVQVSTYQVARSLTLIFTIVLSYYILRQKQTRESVMASLVMVTGFSVGSLDTSTLSLAGILAGGFSSAFQAFYNVTVKKILPLVDDDPNLLLYYNLWWSSILFIPMITLSGEGGVFSILKTNMLEPGFFGQWGSLFFSGVLATLMNLAGYWCIKVTSPLTFNVVAISKSVIQSLGGIVILGDSVSIQSLLGICLTLGGSGWYSFIKMPKQTAIAVTKETAENAELELQAKQPILVDVKRALEEELSLVKEQSHSLEETLSTEQHRITNREYRDSTIVATNLKNNTKEEAEISSNASNVLFKLRPEHVKFSE